MEIRGAASPEEAETVARELRDQGVQLLDLCGGFDEALTARVVTAVEGKIPVGAVRLAPEEIRRSAPSSRYGFVFKGPGMASERCRCTFEAPNFSLEIRGVGSPEEGERVSRELRDAGVELLGLCGGFHEALVARVAAAVEHKIPVGAVQYAPEEAEKLARFREIPEA